MESENQVSSKSLNLIITTCVPYIYELHEILILPTKAEYRNRFKPKYIEESMRGKENANKFEEYEGKYANLILKTNDLYIPIRRVKIFSVTAYSTMVYIRYELDEFFDYSSNVASCINELTHFTSKLEDELKKLVDSDGKTPLVYESSISANRVNSEVDQNEGLEANVKEFNQWGHLAKVLESKHHFQFVPFLKILSIKDVREDKDFKKNIINGAIMLKPNSTYRIAILHEILDSPKPTNGDLINNYDSKFPAPTSTSPVTTGKSDEFYPANNVKDNQDLKNTHNLNQNTNGNIEPKPTSLAKNEYFEHAPYIVSVSNIAQGLKVLSGPKTAIGKSDVLEFLIKTSSDTVAINDVINIKHITPGQMSKHSDGTIELQVEVEASDDKLKKAKIGTAFSLNFYLLTLLFGITGIVPEPFTAVASDFAVASVAISLALYFSTKNNSTK
ncbi:MAG: hypothetical protein ACI9LX_001000 [Paraglaciecola sp.]|jgi:hypothetical protein